MTQAEYDVLRAEGHGRFYCVCCRAMTWFTRDDHGVLFCISCGQEAEVTRDPESQRKEVKP